MEKLIQNVWKLMRKILEFIVFKILQLKFSEKIWEQLIQFVKFGIIGLSNTIISYVIYVITLLFLQKHQYFPQIDYLIGQFIGFIISVLWSFYWNRKYVFDADNEKVPWPQALLKTYVSYAFTGIFLNSILSVLWVEWFGIPKIVAPIINLLISVPLNFILNKFWAFKNKDTGV